MVCWPTPSDPSAVLVNVADVTPPAVLTGTVPREVFPMKKVTLPPGGKAGAAPVAGATGLMVALIEIGWPYRTDRLVGMVVCVCAFLTFTTDDADDGVDAP